LEEAGCRVYVARDGHEAVALLAGDGLRARIDLLFSDVVLPNGVDGVTVAREARRLRPEINVLLTSGYAEDVLARRGPRMDRMLAKPYRPKDLLREAAMLLSVHRPRLVATGTER
jgi:CheY-like chemotaxis protein